MTKDLDASLVTNFRFLYSMIKNNIVYGLTSLKKKCCFLLVSYQFLHWTAILTSVILCVLHWFSNVFYIFSNVLHWLWLVTTKRRVNNYLLHHWVSNILQYLLICTYITFVHTYIDFCPNICFILVLSSIHCLAYMADVI